MIRLDTSTPLAEVSDFVLELAQPDGSTTRICVSLSRPPVSLSIFLKMLAQEGAIAMGGGNPAWSSTLASEARQRGLQMRVDDDSRFPSYTEYVYDGMEDPFADEPGEGPVRNFVIRNGEVCYVPPAERGTEDKEAEKKRGMA
jgi:hypothetical protein